MHIALRSHGEVGDHDVDITALQCGQQLIEGQDLDIQFDVHPARHQPGHVDIEPDHLAIGKRLGHRRHVAGGAKNEFTALGDAGKSYNFV